MNDKSCCVQAREMSGCPTDTQFFFRPKRFSMDNADNKGLPTGGVAALR
jgi:hypothetical protein